MISATQISPNRAIVENFRTSEYDCKSWSSLFDALQRLLSDEKYQDAFDITYSLFKYLSLEAPQSVKEAFDSIWSPPQYQDLMNDPYFETEGLQAGIELAAIQHGNEYPNFINMTKVALSNSACRNALLMHTLFLYINHFFPKETPSPQEIHPLSCLNDAQQGSPEDLWKNDVTTLWGLGAEGNFLAALDRLIPLVNFLHRQEDLGVFPLGIRKSDSKSISELRYGGGNTSLNNAFSTATENTRNAIHLAITHAQDKNHFYNPAASITAAKMLALMTSVEGLAFHLPSDLARLMQGLEDQKTRPNFTPQGSAGTTNDHALTP